MIRAGQSLADRAGCCTGVGAWVGISSCRAQCVAPYLSAAVQQSSVAGLVKAFLHKCNADAGSSDEEEDDGVDLCNCEFSLAYGEDS